MTTWADRFLYYDSMYYNFTVTDDFTSNFEPASDVSVNAVVTSIYLNAAAFVVLMLTYEVLRKLLPSVYSSAKKQQFKRGHNVYLPPGSSESTEESKSQEEEAGDESSSGPLPDVFSSFNWVPKVFSVSWATVRKTAGLDGYFFLRFIRMNLRICAVTSFWAFAILVPIYATGNEQNGEVGWYHLSVANVEKKSWRMWAPPIFAYMFTGFIFFVMKQEYRHFLDIRMEFLAKGTDYVNPQHHYSLMVENIPYELRSEKALYDYFDKLFPGKVHSASVVMNLPDLEAIKAKCLRVCRRLEKSIAYFHATNKRPTHNVGSARIHVCGIDMAPCDWSCGQYPEATYIMDAYGESMRPEKGTHVDSIAYYTHDLAELNKDMFFMQRDKAEIAMSGNNSADSDSWFSRMVTSANLAANQIMMESAEDNALRASYTAYSFESGRIPQAEMMTSRYGSFGPLSDRSPVTSENVKSFPPKRTEPAIHGGNVGATAILPAREGRPPLAPSAQIPDTEKSPSQEHLLEKDGIMEEDFEIPGHSSKGSSSIRRLAGRLGLDFVVAIFRFLNSQVDQMLEGLVPSTMSSTGFVTFLDLTSVACAAKTPLTTKPQVLDISVAPEPRDIIWYNAPVSAKTRSRREQQVNALLTVGILFWIFPLSAIQTFAKAENLAKIPGLEWIKTFDGGSISNFVNGYLPVVALLCLILILPVIFQLLALKVERRSTFSDVQHSMMGRYFYYQIINIYVTVTAGSLLKSLAEIIDHPSKFFEILGESLPSMVGYFVALLVTKILAGLPIVFLRVGALSRMLLLRTISSGRKLTQRELEEVYRPENVQYGWEFPTQLLVIMIVFTYAAICPIIVPFGMMYFTGSLIVYKKQVLYVYQSVYESGGAMFPSALQRTLAGLTLGQCTLLGYLLTRGCYYQPILLIPLPIITLLGMRYFDRHYKTPSNTLSLERAREFDRVSETVAEVENEQSENIDVSDPLRRTRSLYGIEGRREQFDVDAYKQPVLTQRPMMPRVYRAGQMDPITQNCREQLKALQDQALTNESDESRLRVGNSFTSEAT